MKLLVKLLAGAVIVTGAAAARAQAYVADAERCVSITNNSDLAIQYCTRAIESGRITGEDLARLHFSRGVEWANKNENDRALADYDAAIRLSPKFADAYYNRGNIWANKGEPDRAIADYDAAIRLNPKDVASHVGRAVELTLKGDYARAGSDYEAALRMDPKSADAYFGRGRARFYSGDYPRAIADFEQALKLEPNGYTPIWLYLARRKSGAPSAEDALDNETRAFRNTSWPGTLIVFYLGRTDVNSVFAAATDPDPRMQRENRCEANFYLAHWHLLRGEQALAAPLLNDARDNCPRSIVEYEGAVTELRRLQR
jgi:lipoprotein NlpI